MLVLMIRGCLLHQNWPSTQKQNFANFCLGQRPPGAKGQLCDDVIMTSLHLKYPRLHKIRKKCPVLDKTSKHVRLMSNLSKKANLFQADTEGDWAFMRLHQLITHLLPPVNLLQSMWQPTGQSAGDLVSCTTLRRI